MSLFLNGIPYAIDLKKLDDEFGVPSEGQSFGYQALAKCIGYPVDSSRYKGVIDAWRKKLLKNHNVLLLPIGQKQGLKVAAPNERIDYAGAQVDRGRSHLRKATLVSGTTDTHRLDEGHRALQANIAQLAQINLKLQTRVMPKELPIP